jgi:monoamine oxidase
MEKIHPGFASHRQRSAALRWVNDPLTLGGWSWPGPGFLSAHLETLRQPRGRVHFAGEHTSLLRATMEGALESGVRAATEIEAQVQQSAGG